MTTDPFAAMVLLAVATCFAPGVNNSLVALSAANFGFARTIPHIAGIVIGFPLMVFLVGLALGELFRATPGLQVAITWIGALVLLWMAWKMFKSGGLTTPDGKPRPFRFLEAAAFQWVNPKAWTLSVAVTAQFVTTEAPVRSALIVATVFGFAVLGSNVTWGAAGLSLRGLGPSARHWIARALALLLVATVGLILAAQFPPK